MMSIIYLIDHRETKKKKAEKEKQSLGSFPKTTH